MKEHKIKKKNYFYSLEVPVCRGLLDFGVFLFSEVTVTGPEKVRRDVEDKPYVGLGNV